MSDRRSFSEIPTELLREHDVNGRVDRIWERLDAELAGRSRVRRSAPIGWALVSACTFAAGIFVGTHWNTRQVEPLAMFGAEPVHHATPAAALKPGAMVASETAPELHPSRPLRRGALSRRTEAETTAPKEPAEEAPQTTGSEWQRLAEEGEYVQALAALEASGGFDVALGKATADELMSLVDVARATGQRDRAVLALRRIVSEHSADPNASVAAWMLGNELAKARDLAGAEQAFAAYRGLSPNGDFAEDALARQIDMASELGNLDHARGLAEQYLKEFPDGPRTADIQAELERWGHEPPAAAAAGEPARASVDTDASAPL